MPDFSAMIQEGLILPVLPKGRIGSAHLVRWAAAMENWEKIHYDLPFARDIAKLPERVINGSLKQQFLAQFFSEAFDGRGWVWRLRYRFEGMDVVGQALELRGKVVAVDQTASHRFVTVDAQIVNLDTGVANTSARGVVVLARDGAVVTSFDGVEAPEALCADLTRVEHEGEIPPKARALLGTTMETLTSHYPVSASRLRLFAEAVMDLRPHHYDPTTAMTSAFGGLVAPPLFPLHAIELLPGTSRLSENPAASGREGSSGIIGRALAQKLDVDETGLLSGGSEVEIRSLARAGDFVQVDSVLTGARRRQGRRAGDLLVLERTHTYRAQDGRILMWHRPTTIIRMDVVRP